MMVCPHDTIHEPERWYCLERYIIRHLGVTMQCELSLDFADFRENLHKADIVYVNPSDRLKLLADHGYVSIARPEALYDEVVFITNTEIEQPSIELFRGADVVTVTTLILTPLAVQVLREQGIQIGNLRHKDSWQGVVSSVWKREFEVGFLSKDVYDRLSEHGRSLVTVVGTSDIRQAYHTIDISPRLVPRQAEIEQLFWQMHNDPEGREIVEALAVGRWLPVDPAELTRMADLMKA